MDETTGGRSSRGGPSAEQWLARRSIITKLYQQHTLKYVQQVMSENYGFCASKRMYDRKLKQWNISKNIKAAEKEEILDMLVQTGTWPSKSPPNSRARELNIDPQKYSKALRHARMQKRSPGGGSLSSQVRENINNSQTGEGVKELPQASVTDPWIHVSSASPIESISPNATDYCNSTLETPEVLMMDLTTTWQHSLGSGMLSGSFTEQLDRYSAYTPLHSSTTSSSQEVYLPESDFILFPPPSISHPTKSLNLESMLKSIASYTRLTSNLTMGSGFPLSPYSCISPEPGSISSPFWHELKQGIYLLKISSSSAWSVIDKACDLAPRTFRSPAAFDATFLINLLTVLSPVNLRILPKVRIQLLQYLSYLAHFKLPKGHPIATICHELQQDDQERAVSEQALLCFKDTIHTLKTSSNLPTTHQDRMTDLAFRIECSIITLLRRDKVLDTAAEKAQSLLHRCQNLLLAFWGPATITPASRRALQQARMAATELAHIRMDQRGEHYEDAVALSLFVLTGRPLLPGTLNFSEDAGMGSMVRDEDIIRGNKSIYTLEDLCKICEELNRPKHAVQWLERAYGLSVDVLGEGDTSTVHVKDKLVTLRNGLVNEY